MKLTWTFAENGKVFFFSLKYSYFDFRVVVDLYPVYPVLLCLKVIS